MMIAIALPALVGACASINDLAAVDDYGGQAPSSVPAIEYSGIAPIPPVVKPPRNSGGATASRSDNTRSRVSFSSYPGNGAYICSPSGFGQQSSCFLR
ncbi:MAG: hypothetical protein EA385_01245 [Salinarimonadaceae bacterium]|nr:MAG: hypothetical protein EA385_01245 [Salinarimonadaceae bacterium]